MCISCVHFCWRKFIYAYLDNFINGCNVVIFYVCFVYRCISRSVDGR